METTKTKAVSEEKAITHGENHNIGNGGFLVSPCPPGTIFTREQLNEEQLEIGKVTYDFCKSKIAGCPHDLDKKPVDDDGTPVLVKLFREAAEQGLVSAGIPEEYDGLGMDLITDMFVSENLCRFHASFSVTCIAHLGIGTKPILLFGTEEQKKKYLPKLATGEFMGCYALTEPGSGSDALSGRTEARLEGDHYVLNGSKQFITNGGWADVAVVFTRIEDKYSALIVDLDLDGVSRGAEEKKMGIKGSSTTTLTFDNVKVPKENLLGKLGDAANIALNILNIGRLALGFAVQGGARTVINTTIKYIKERKQFGRSLAEFDMQLAKLADMTVRLFGIESINFRTAAPIDEKINAQKSQGFSAESLIQAVRSFAMESSICKVEGSEAQYNICENAVKMHGGYGYTSEYSVEREFRDCIINMIYEGTNDINRLVIFDFLVRNIYSGGIPYRVFTEEVQQALRTREFNYAYSEVAFEDEKKSVYAAKYAVAYLVEKAILRYGKDISNQQQVIEHISDMLIHLYVADSVIARCHYLKDHGSYGEVEEAIAKVTTIDRLEKIRTLARRAIWDVAHDYDMDRSREDLEWLLSHTEYNANVFPLKRVIGQAVLEKEQYYL